jgi:hypothetical protein
VSYATSTRGFFPEVKWPGREFDQSHMSSAEANNVCVCVCGVAAPPLTYFMTWCLIKDRDKFSFP